MKNRLLAQTPSKWPSILAKPYHAIFEDSQAGLISGATRGLSTLWMAFHKPVCSTKLGRKPSCQDARNWLSFAWILLRPTIGSAWPNDP